MSSELRAKSQRAMTAAPTGAAREGILELHLLELSYDLWQSAPKRRVLRSVRESAAHEKCYSIL